MSAYLINLHYFCIIASDHLFNDASRLVTRSAAAITKLQELEPKLMIYDEESKQQCLEVRNVVLHLNSVCVCMYVCVCVCVWSSQMPNCPCLI